MTKNKTKADLKPLGAVIQSCPDCAVALQLENLIKDR